MSSSSRSESSENGEDLNTTIICNNPPKKKRGRTNSHDAMLAALQSMESRLSSKIESSIESLAARLDSKIDSFVANLDNKIDCVERDLNAKIIAVATTFENKVIELENKSKEIEPTINKIVEDVDKLKNLQRHYENTLDKFERECLLTRLVISGIPYVPNEDLKNICENIANAIGCSPSFSGVYRSPSTKKESTIDDMPSTSKGIRTSSIIIKFATIDERYEFLHHYFKFKLLNLTHIGFKTPSRIFINDLLTKKNSEILHQIRKIKKSGIISRYHISRGIVFAHKMVNDVLVTSPIFDKEQLATFG